MAGFVPVTLFLTVRVFLLSWHINCWPLCMIAFAVICNSTKESLIFEWGFGTWITDLFALWIRSRALSVCVELGNDVGNDDLHRIMNRWHDGYVCFDSLHNMANYITSPVVFLNSKKCTPELYSSMLLMIIIQPWYLEWFLNSFNAKGLFSNNHFLCHGQIIKAKHVLTDEPFVELGLFLYVEIHHGRSPILSDSIQMSRRRWSTVPFDEKN